jgi:hypothetical protein
MDCKKRIKHPGKSNRPIRAHGIKINPNYLQQKQQELTTGQNALSFINHKQ